MKMAGEAKMSNMALEGIKVADFSWVAAGPQIGRELAANGATVVRVESHRRPDMIRMSTPFKDGKPGWNRSAFYASVNSNKFGISIDLATRKGKDAAERLVKWADVVLESLQPGAMAKLGLAHDTCLLMNPSLIYCSTSMLGQWGPHGSFVGTGFHTNALAGLCQCTGWPDSGPTMMGSQYSDYVAPWYAVLAIVAALAKRRETGRGMYIEQSQLEAGLSMMSLHLLDYAANGRVVGRMGNRDRYMCPHGVYPCKEGRWVAIAVADGEQWHSFCRVLRELAWTREARFQTVMLRKQNEDELDRLISEWTKSFAAEEVTARLQDAGIAAGAVQRGQDLLQDPQFKHRQHYQVLRHPEMGEHSYNAPAYRLSKTPWKMVRPAPCMGEHNMLVLKDMLGYSEDDVADMLAEGAITTDADLFAI
jgi:benzylsuccinate CoA-transferase BbsF subunit